MTSAELETKLKISTFILPFHTTSSTQAATDGIRSRRKFSNFFFVFSLTPKSITRNVLFRWHFLCLIALFVSPFASSFRLSRQANDFISSPCCFYTFRAAIFLLLSPPSESRSGGEAQGEGASIWKVALPFALIIFIISRFFYAFLKCLKWRLFASLHSTFFVFCFEDANRNR